ncbi:hypothetical protein ABZ114_08925 [Streptomyces albidoflavus]|uniref:hypothetical protein n=1 Tax=Streptomyces TaxID=1883 RepID=UPI000A7B3C9D|nr:hypothetical protein [Streptomyces sp. KE1]
MIGIVTPRPSRRPRRPDGPGIRDACRQTAGQALERLPSAEVAKAWEDESVPPGTPAAELAVRLVDLALSVDAPRPVPDAVLAAAAGGWSAAAA